MCKRLLEDEHSLREQVANYEFEAKEYNKNSILAGIQTLAYYYKSDLVELNESLDEYINLLSDRTMTKIKIPGYMDERSVIAWNAEEKVSDFKYVYDQVVQNLDIFINEPKGENMGKIRDVIDSEFHANELDSSIDDISENMMDEFDLMIKKVDELKQINTNKR